MLERGQLAACHLTDVRIGIAQQLTMLGNVALQALAAAVRLDRLLELRSLARQLGVLAAVRRERRVGHQTLELLVSPLDLCETFEHRRPSHPTREPRAERIAGRVRPRRWSRRPTSFRTSG